MSEPTQQKKRPIQAVEKHPAQSPLKKVKNLPAKISSAIHAKEKHPAQSPLPQKTKPENVKRPAETELVGPPQKKTRREKMKEKKQREKEMPEEEEIPIETDPSDPTFGIISSDNPYASLSEEVSTSTVAKETKPKKPKKEKKKKEKKPSTFEMVFGADAKPSIDLKWRGEKQDLKVRDIQSLLLWIFADGVNPVSWVTVSNKALIKRAVVVMLDSLGTPCFKKENFPNFERIFSSNVEGIPTRGAGGKGRVYHGLNIFLHRTKPKSKYDKDKKGPTKGTASERFLPQAFLLDTEGLIENKFPRDGPAEFTGFYRFPAPTPKSESLVALDCEMCQIHDRSLQLARISIVNGENKVLYDKFIKPEAPIFDHLTRWSGITPQIMAEATLTYDEMIKEISEIISNETIIVGHSLDSDLLAMKVIHSKILDTSVLFPHPNDGYKNGLKFLAQRYLNQSIQEGEHDSIQDAVTAMKLVHLYLEKGPGIAEVDGAQEPICNVFHQFGKKCVVIDTPGICKTYANACPNLMAYPLIGEKELMDKALEESKKPENDFVFAHFHSLEERYKAKALESYFLKEDDEREQAILQGISKDWDATIGQIYDSLEKNTLLICFTGNGNIHRIKEIQKTKSSAGTSWSVEDEAGLVKAIEEARDGLAWIVLKTD